MKVIWTDSAILELDAIYIYYSKRISNVIAENLVVNIVEQSEKQLDIFPESGAIENNLSDLNYKYRYLLIGNYKIIYRVEKKVVYIVKVFDCRLDPDKMKNIEIR